jgi:integrase
MQPEATTSNPTQKGERQFHGPTFAKVLDGRKQPIRGLWVRNGRYYAQLTVEDPNTGEKQVRRVPLVDKDDKPPETVPQAVALFNALKSKRAEGDLPALRQTPKFCDYVDAYLKTIGGELEDGKHDPERALKKAGTVSKERSTLTKWKEHLGELRIDRIRRPHITAFIEKRKAKRLKNRTVNLDVIALRNVLKKAVDDGWIQSLPTLNMRPLKVTTKSRPLFSHAELEKLCATAFETKTDKHGKAVPLTENAQQFVDYMRFMSYTGARRNEALAILKSSIDFEREQVTIGADGNTKNSQARIVPFNPKLKALLLDMRTRWAPDTKWLFPSPQRGEKDIHAQTFRESLELVRERAGMPHVGFHDCRHLFISYCVMSGIDYMTIAKWVGHQDGGILIGKVYGHLADSHVKAQAQKLTFEPVLMQAQAV